MKLQWFRIEVELVSSLLAEALDIRFQNGTVASPSRNARNGVSALETVPVTGMYLSSTMARRWPGTRARRSPFQYLFSVDHRVLNRFDPNAH
jgi:hypothetical protein